MAEQEQSYLKKNNPNYYSFFKEYWSFVKKYWRVYPEEEWWNCFLADMNYYIARNDSIDFFVDLLMAFYKKTRDEQNNEFTVNDVFTFLQEWWKFVNEFYVTRDEKSYWADFFKRAKELSDKYGKSEYYIDVIDAFIKMKTAGQQITGVAN